MASLELFYIVIIQFFFFCLIILILIQQSSKRKEENEKLKEGIREVGNSCHERINDFLTEWEEFKAQQGEIKEEKGMPEEPEIEEKIEEKKTNSNIPTPPTPPTPPLPNENKEPPASIKLKTQQSELKEALRKRRKKIDNSQQEV